ncbi:MAG TPA: STAS domain-containing protein [Streptosporangiaceae bacterium]
MALPAEIDIANADAVCELLCAALRPGVGVVVGDLSGTTFCDVSGVRAVGPAPQAAEPDQAGRSAADLPEYRPHGRPAVTARR